MGPRPLGIGTRMSPQKLVPSPRVSRTRFRRCRSNHLGVGRGRNIFWNAGAPPLRMGMWLENCCSPSVFIPRHTRPQVKRFERIITGNLPGNFDRSRPAFGAHSRSLEPTRIDRLHITSYW